MPDLDPSENDPEMLKDALSFVTKRGVGCCIVMAIVWPLLSLPAGLAGVSGVECGVFSKDYFILWVSVAVAWGILATAVIIILPLSSPWTASGSAFQGHHDQRRRTCASTASR